MTQEVRQFVLDCPVWQVEKGSHLKPAGKLMPLEVPIRKWDYVVLDLVLGFLVQGEFDTICTWSIRPPKGVILSLPVKNIRKAIWCCSILDISGSDDALQNYSIGISVLSKSFQKLAE